MFQFLSHEYDGNSQTKEGLTGMVAGSFLSGTTDSTGTGGSSSSGSSSVPGGSSSSGSSSVREAVHQVIHQAVHLEVFQKKALGEEKHDR